VRLEVRPSRISGLRCGEAFHYGIDAGGEGSLTIHLCCSSVAMLLRVGLSPCYRRPGVLFGFNPGTLRGVARCMSTRVRGHRIPGVRFVIRISWCIPAIHARILSGLDGLGLFLPYFPESVVPCYGFREP